MHNFTTLGKTAYLESPMEISIALDVFQDKMIMLFQYIGHIFIHMENLVIISNDTYKITWVSYMRS